MTRPALWKKFVSHTLPFYQGGGRGIVILPGWRVDSEDYSLLCTLERMFSDLLDQDEDSRAYLRFVYADDGTSLQKGLIHERVPSVDAARASRHHQNCPPRTRLMTSSSRSLPAATSFKRSWEATRSTIMACPRSSCRAQFARKRSQPPRPSRSFARVPTTAGRASSWLPSLLTSPRLVVTACIATRLRPSLTVSVRSATLSLRLIPSPMTLVPVVRGARKASRSRVSSFLLYMLQTAVHDAHAAPDLAAFDAFPKRKSLERSSGTCRYVWLL